MPDLLRLEIPQGVGVEFYTFGIFLLNDETGSQMDILKNQCQGKPKEVTRMILQQWLMGNGLPVTWESLIKTLRDIKLPAMADKIQENLR